MINEGRASPVEATFIHSWSPLICCLNGLAAILSHPLDPSSLRIHTDRQHSAQSVLRGACRTRARPLRTTLAHRASRSRCACLFEVAPPTRSWWMRSPTGSPTRRRPLHLPRRHCRCHCHQSPSSPSSSLLLRPSTRRHRRVSRCRAPPRVYYAWSCQLVDPKRRAPPPTQSRMARWCVVVVVAVLAALLALVLASPWPLAPGSTHMKAEAACHAAGGAAPPQSVS